MGEQDYTLSVASVLPLSSPNDMIDTQRDMGGRYGGWVETATLTTKIPILPKSAPHELWVVII